MFALKINDLDHKIKNKIILKNISIDLEEDKIACILGPSGCGKTTLLKLNFKLNIEIVPEESILLIF